MAQTAYRWKVLPELNRTLGALEVAVAEPARTSIRKLSREAFLRSSMVAARGSEAIGVLDSAGVPAIAFKGFAIVARAGGQRGDRTLQDVDIIVERENLTAVIEALEKHGYERGFPGELETYLRFVRHSPGFAGNEALNLRNAHGGEIDIHWQAGPRRSARFHARALLSRARNARLRGRTILVPCNVDAALLTIHHSLRNNLTPDDIIRDLLDLEVWIALMGTDGETGSFVTTVGECAMAVPALALTEILQRARPTTTVGHVRNEIASAMTARELSTARKMVELFDVQLREGPLNPDMLYLLHGGPLKSITSGALGGWSRYREQMSAFEARRHGSQVSLRRRAVQLLASLIRSRTRDWRALLELSRVKMQ